MTAVSRIKHLFWLSVMFLSAMSATILVIPAAVHEEGNAGGLPKIIAIFIYGKTTAMILLGLLGLKKMMIL